MRWQKRSILITDEQNGHLFSNSSIKNQKSKIKNRWAVYVRVRDRKFWIEEDWTEDGIATDLVRAGVPKEDIVLAFHEPGMRQYTDFAVAS